MKDFYIGYLEKAPESYRRFIKSLLMILIPVVLIFSAAFSSLQNDISPATFEYQEFCTYEGIILEQPYPRVLIPRPGNTGELPAYSQYYLTVFGKESAKNEVSGYDAMSVSLDAALIYRDNQTMLELKDGAPIKKLEATDVRELISDQKSLPEESFGIHSIKGEIVDSKCYLGVMNPGNLKVHKSCAISCIKGGMPPVFVAKDEVGNVAYYLLEDLNGNPVFDQVLDKVAEPLEIKGEVIKQGDLVILRASPDSYMNL